MLCFFHFLYFWSATWNCVHEKTHYVCVFNWGEPERAPYYRGLQDHVHRPTNRPCPSHSRDTDTLHVPTLPHCHATLMWTVQCVVVIATRLRMLTMGKWKVETPAQQTVRLEWERDQWTSSYLCFLVSVAMHPWVSCTSVFLTGYFTQTLFHTFLHKHNTCTLHSEQDIRTHIWACIDLTLSLSMPPKTQLRPAPSNDHMC